MNRFRIFDARKMRRGTYTVIVVALLALAAALTMSPAFAQQPAPQQPTQPTPGQNFQQQRRPFPHGPNGRPPRPGRPGLPGQQPQQPPQQPNDLRVPPSETTAGQGNHEGTEGDRGEHGDARHEHGEHEAKPFNFADFGNKEVTPYAALLINFALLIGLYYMMGKKGVADGLKKRRERVAKEIEDAQKMLKEAEGRAKTYQSKLKNLESELASAKKALEEAGKGERDRIVRDAEEKAARMKRDAAFLVEQEVKQMRDDLTQEAVEIAMQAAAEMLKSKVTDQDHDRLAQDFLAELDRGPAPSVTSAGGAA